MADIGNMDALAGFDRRVLAPLARLRLRLRAYLFLDGLAAVLFAMLAAATSQCVLDWMFRPLSDVRYGMLLAVIAVVAVVVWRRLIAPLSVPLTPSDLAVLIERGAPSLRSRLVSAVEFREKIAAGALAEEVCSPAMVRQLFDHVQAEAHGVAWNRVLDPRRLRRSLLILAACVAYAICAVALAGGAVRLWLARDVLLRNDPWPQKTRLAIEALDNGRLICAHGDDLVLAAGVLPGYETPRQVFLDYETTTGVSGSEQMLQIGRDRFERSFPRVAASMRCRVRGGDERTDWVNVEVVDRPAVAGVTIRVIPPKYTGEAAYDLRSGLTVAEAPAGSAFEFHITTNKPVAKAELWRGANRLDDAVTRVDEAQWIGHDKPTGSADYQFHLTDQLGLSSQSERSRPTVLSVRLIPTRPPKVVLKVRGVGDTVTPEAVLPIQIECSNTYGLASAELVQESTRLTQGPKVTPVEGFEPHRKQFTRTLSLPLSPLGLQPTDRYSLSVRASDYDDVGGPNVGQSTVVSLRVVTREELMNDLARREQQYRQEFERCVRAQEDLYGAILSTLQAVGNGQAGEGHRRSFAQHERLQRQQATRIESIRRGFEQILAEMETNQALAAAEQERLGRHVITPMGVIVREQMPAAMSMLEHLSRQDDSDLRRQLAPQQQQLLAAMRAILAGMLKYEGFQEAVGLLRDVLKLQSEVNQETQRQMANEIENLFGTTAPATREAKP